MTTIALNQPPSLGTVFRAYHRSLFIAYQRVRWGLTALALLTVIGFTVSIVQDLREEQALSRKAVSQQAQPHPSSSVNAVGPAGVAITVNSAKIGTKTTPSTDAYGNIVTTMEVEPTLKTEIVKAFAKVWILFGMGVACIFAFRGWRGQQPSRRTYHWVMPVERSTHVVVRVLAGWLLLVTTFVVGALFVWFACSLTCTIASVYYGGTLASVLREVWGMNTSDAQIILLLVFVYPLAAVTITYGIVSAAVVAVESPVYWLVGIVIAYLTVPWISGKLSVGQIGAAVKQVWHGTYGLRTALFGPGPVAIADFMQGRDFAHWWPVTLLWLGISAAIFLISAGASAKLQQRSA